MSISTVIPRMPNDPKFFLLTERYLILRVVERWRIQYSAYDDIRGLKYDGPKKIIYDKLLQLDLNDATAQQVNDIIGNNSWTSQRCDACGSHSLPAIVSSIREEHHTTCINCLNAMHKMITEIK